MRSPTKMYYLKPILVHDFAVETPKCMYKLSNIHSPSRKLDGSEEHVIITPARKLDIIEQNSQEVPGMAELEARQGAILGQLAELKRQISGLKKELNLQTHSAPKQKQPPLSSCITTINQNNALPDTVVIGASPTSPPYSLELLQRLLQDQISLAVTCYLHSSVPSLPEGAARLQEVLADFKPNDGVPVVTVRLIWKNLSSNAEILLSHTPISGEVNLLRYLSRATNTTLSYDSDANFLEIDSILDQCYFLSRSKTKTERAGLFQTLNKSMNKSAWLAGKSHVGVADLAVYSAIKQSGSDKELGVGLAKWFQKCVAL